MIGKKIIFKTALESTNNYIANLLSENKIENGTVILAEEQLNGKGQRGTKWDAEKGKNIIFSCYIEHDNLAVNNQFILNQIVSLACCDLLNDFKSGFKIKWPNDIVYNSSKIAGILIENHIEGHLISKSIIGIGINVNQYQFGPYNATSLTKLCNEEFDIKSIVLQLISKLNLRLTELNESRKENIELDYQNNLWLFEKNAEFKDDSGIFKGKIIGITEFGQLLIDTGNSIKKFNNKEVVFLERFKA